MVYAETSYADAGFGLLTSGRVNEQNVVARVENSVAIHVDMFFFARSVLTHCQTCAASRGP